MTPKKCLFCENFVKLKQFSELRTQFHNWCGEFERPVALCKCKGSEIAMKYLEEKNNKTKNVDNNNLYNILKVDFPQT